MNSIEFKNLYHLMFEQKQQEVQKQKDNFLIQFDIQDTKFAFFRNEEKKFLCKFSFDFLDEPQRVTVIFNGKTDLEFSIDDTEDNEQKYDLKKFKEYFNPQFLLFKEAFERFKQFLESKQKLKQEKNILTVIPLDVLMNRDKDKQVKLNIDGLHLTFNQILNAFKDTFRVDFELAQADNLESQKYITAVFKVLASQNYYILEVYLTKQQNDLQNATNIDKDQFAKKYPTYFEKLNKGIKTFLQMNN